MERFQYYTAEDLREDFRTIAATLITPPFVIWVRVGRLRAKALIDSGATGNFMNEEFARRIDCKKGTTRLRRVDTSRKTIEICGISAEDMKAHIASKTDDVHVLWTKNPEVGLHRINLRSEKKSVISGIYSYFKELFEKK